MYTVYDFINTNIEPKHMKFGWKIELTKTQSLSSLNTEIILTYTMLNFDWSSLKYISNELWNMFLNSYSYKRMVEKKDRARKKYKRLYFSAYSIEELKYRVEENKLKINIDRLIGSVVKKKSEKIKQKIEKDSLQQIRKVI